MKRTYSAFTASLIMTSIALAGSITHLGDWYVSGSYEEVIISGNRALVADVYGMVALDISNPDNIYPLSHQSGLGYSYSLEAVGDIVYLANWQDSLIVSDYSVPQNPVRLQQLDLPGEMYSIDIEEDVAAIACGGVGVFLLDVSTPDDPQIISNIIFNGFAVDAEIVGNWLFVAGFNAGVFAFDISDPYDPEPGGIYTDIQGVVRDVDYESGFLYLAEENFGLEVLNAMDPDTLFLCGDWPSSVDYVYLDAQGAYLYACTVYDGLRIHDIFIPSQPNLIRVIDTEGEAWGATAHGTRLYLADGPAGLKVYDISSGSQTPEISRYEILGRITGVSSVGNIVYAAARKDSLQVFELLGSFLQWRGAASTPDSARSVTVHNNTLLVACGEAGVVVLDVSLSPYAPQLLTVVNTPGKALRIVVSGNYAWVADKAAGVSVVDISVPASANYLTTIPTEDEALGIAKSGNYLYVADRDFGLRIYNVLNLYSPYYVGGLILPDEAIDVALYGSYALVADFGAGLRIIDVSSPQAPWEVAHIDLPGHAERVIISGQYAYVALHDKGIALVDVLNPQNPVLEAYLESPGSAVDLALINQKIILADTYCLGLYEFEPSVGVQPVQTEEIPEEFFLETPYPNPFNPTTLLSYHLPQGAFVSLKIYDLSGREVAEIFRGFQQVGSYDITFNGNGLPSGIYLAHLIAGSNQAVQKVVLMK